MVTNDSGELESWDSGQLGEEADGGVTEPGDGDELCDGALALKPAPATSATAITREQRRSRRKR